MTINTVKKYEITKKKYIIFMNTASVKTVWFCQVQTIENLSMRLDCEE